MLLISMHDRFEHITSEDMSAYMLQLVHKVMLECSQVVSKIGQSGSITEDDINAVYRAAERNYG